MIFLENQDPNNATVAETGEIRDPGDSQGTENESEEKKSFHIIKKVDACDIIFHSLLLYISFI